MDDSGVTLAVVGATGAVGREMIDILIERQFPIGKLKLVASERSAGTEIEIDDESIKVEALTAEAFVGVDIALFAAGGSISAEFAPIAAESGAIVIDNSSHFRMDPRIPLIVPEVNATTLSEYLQSLPAGQGGIIANPNCSTAQLVVVLKPLLDAVGIKRVVVSTYQSVSGAGQKGMDELWNQCLAIFNQQEVAVEKFAHQIAFNCLPHIDTFLDNGYTKEEWKVIQESRKILGKEDLRITATAARIPVFSCHSESVNIETERPLTADAARAILRESPGIIVLDDPEDNLYPMSVELQGTDATYVGRVRVDESVEHGINLWVVADNLRKGAALNAVQIAEIVHQERLVRKETLS